MAELTFPELRLQQTVMALDATKAPVRLLSTSSLALAGLLVVNGVQSAAGDRVAATANGALGGIYIVESGAWKRAADCDATSKVQCGMSFRVTEGTNAGLWSLTTSNPINLGVTSLAFAKEGSSVAAHAATHEPGGSDPVGSSDPEADTIAARDETGKLKASAFSDGAAMELSASLSIWDQCKTSQFTELSTPNATPASIVTAIPIEEDAITILHAIVVAKKDGAGESATFELFVQVHDVGGTPTEVGTSSASPVPPSAGAAAWACEFVRDGDNYEIEFTGGAYQVNQTAIVQRIVCIDP